MRHQWNPIAYERQPFVVRRIMLVCRWTEYVNQRADEQPNHYACVERCVRAAGIGLTFRQNEKIKRKKKQVQTCSWTSMRTAERTTANFCFNVFFLLFRALHFRLCEWVEFLFKFGWEKHRQRTWNSTIISRCQIHWNLFFFSFSVFRLKMHKFFVFYFFIVRCLQLWRLVAPHSCTWKRIAMRHVVHSPSSSSPSSSSVFRRNQMKRENWNTQLDALKLLRPIPQSTHFKFIVSIHI